MPVIELWNRAWTGESLAFHRRDQSDCTESPADECMVCGETCLPGELLCPECDYYNDPIAAAIDGNPVTEEEVAAWPY